MKCLLGYSNDQIENDNVTRQGDEPAVVVTFNTEQRRMAALIESLQERYEQENVGSVQRT